MKGVIVLIISMLLLFNTSMACLNYYYTVDSDGDLHSLDDLGWRNFNLNFNNPLIQKKLLTLSNQLKTDGDYKLLSDYAVLLMKGGKVEESLSILRKINQWFPDEYTIAANLGTAYELSAKLDSALFFIQKGIRLNEDSHNGSEWVHEALLKAKIKRESDSLHIQQHSILNLSNEQKEDEEIMNQILYQVRERFPFCKGPNEVMANLMLDLGDCMINSFSIEHARAVFDIAMNYYGLPVDSIESRIAKINRLKELHEDVQPSSLLREGTHIKTGFITRKSIMDNNNRDNVQIDWSKIETNPVSLLQLINKGAANVGHNEEVEFKELPKEEAEEKSNYFWLLLATAGLLVVWSVKRRKSTKN